MAATLVVFRKILTIYYHYQRQNFQKDIDTCNYILYALQIGYRVEYYRLKIFLRTTDNLKL